MRSPRHAAVVAILTVVLAGCGQEPSAGKPGDAPSASRPGTVTPAAPDAPAAAARPDGLLVPAGRIAPPEISECSGIAKAGSAWWTHCDSGASPVLWRADTPDFAGAVAFTVPGAQNVDWEDITVLDSDLIVADLGDNMRRRRDCALYRVRHTPGTGGAPGALSLVAKYPVAWPDAPHDCEAVYVKDGKVHAITKDRGDGTGVYRFDTLTASGDLGADERNTPVIVGGLNLGDQEQVTSAAYDAATDTVVVLTYTQIAAYNAGRMSGTPAASMWISARQAEAIAVDGADLVFTNEQRDVFRVPSYREWRHARLLQKRGASRLTAETTEIPLVSAQPGEWARWSLGADGIRFAARIRVKGELTPCYPPRGRPGTGVILCFAPEPMRISGAGTAEIVISTDALATPRVDVVTTAPGATSRTLEPVPGGKASITKEEGHILIEATFPETAPFGRALPGSFLFDLYAYETGLDDGPRHSGLDLFCVMRPYTWGDCTR